MIKRRFIKILVTIFIGALCFDSLLNAQGTSAVSASTQSAKEFRNGGKELVVYSDVNGAPRSPFYRIRVRSMLTKNEWVDCFTHHSYNRAKELGGKTVPMKDGKLLQTTVYHYQKFFADWSHAYGNIEMSPDVSVEVEISPREGFKIGGNAFLKAAAHPANSVITQPVVKDGKIYFSINKPGQIVIDINGQMDDFNKAIDDTSKDKSFVANTVSLFANPIIGDKPAQGAPGVVSVSPGTLPPNNPKAYTTVLFLPGVHKIGMGYKIYPGKKYYIPGDALVYGTFHADGKVNFPAEYKNNSGIKIYGTGTITGSLFTHPNYPQEEVGDLSHKGIVIRWLPNALIEGICVTDPANHSIDLLGSTGSIARWVKVISWRANGDGIGSASQMEDCFIRTGDDCSYIKGSKRRCVFWQDRGAAVFHMANIPDSPILIEDCEVIYNRSRDAGNGGVFVQRGEGKVGLQNVNVMVRNFRVTDPRANAATFAMASEAGGRHGVGSSYSGITFQNVVITHPIVGGQTNEIIGCTQSPWNGGITFENCTIAGNPLTIGDFKMNKFVKDIKFINAGIESK